MPHPIIASNRQYYLADLASSAGGFVTEFLPFFTQDLPDFYLVIYLVNLDFYLYLIRYS